MKIDKNQKVVICVSLKLWMSFPFVALFKRCSNRMEAYILESFPTVLLHLM